MIRHMQENASTTDISYIYENFSYENDACPKTEVTKFARVVTPIIFIMVIMFSLVGNILVLWVLIKYENLKSLTNVFLLNLAISDLVFTFGLPFWSYYRIYGWVLGEDLCVSVSFIFHLGYYSSLIFLTVMTVHRYVAVVHPLSMRLNTSRPYSVLISAFIWLLSFCAATPYLFFIKLHHAETWIYCEYYNIHWRITGIYLQNAFSLVAFITIAFCYIRILGRLLRPTSHTRPKTVKLILCIVTAFYLGWAPYNVAMFLDSLIFWQFPEFTDCNVSTIVDYVTLSSQLVAFSHCSLNPVFYVFMGVKFRNHLKKALSCLCRKDPLERRHSNLPSSNVEEISMP